MKIKHYGSLRSLPHYIGGDDDETEAWQPTCECGFIGKEIKHVEVAYYDLVQHLNEALNED